MFTMTLFVALTVPAVDTDRARQTHDILKTHCYRCHGQNGAVEGGLNYILDFKTLIRRKKIVAGDATRSKLYKRSIGADDPMPPAEEKSRRARTTLHSSRPGSTPALPISRPNPRSAKSSAKRTSCA